MKVVERPVSKPVVKRVIRKRSDSEMEPGELSDDEEDDDEPTEGSICSQSKPEEEVFSQSQTTSNNSASDSIPTAQADPAIDGVTSATSSRDESPSTELAPRAAQDSREGSLTTAEEKDSGLSFGKVAKAGRVASESDSHDSAETKACDANENQTDEGTPTTDDKRDVKDCPLESNEAALPSAAGVYARFQALVILELILKSYLFPEFGFSGQLRRKLCFKFNMSRISQSHMFPLMYDSGINASDVDATVLMRVTYVFLRKGNSTKTDILQVHSVFRTGVIVVFF